MADVCAPQHDYLNDALTFGLCLGLIISYLPQHYRIIHAKSSEGFSPEFLLLGTLSAGSTFFNMVTLQAPIVKCCTVVGYGDCLEMTAGVIQVGIQYVCFSIVFILYLIYYPQHLKYADLSRTEHEALLPPTTTKDGRWSAEWRSSVIAAWIAVIHSVVTTIVTAYMLLIIPPSPDGATPSAIYSWANFLGIFSAILASIQYAPQLWRTWRSKLVGALSIPMMCIQTPGGVLMVVSIARRPGTVWTSWITFAVAAILQGCLLIMCIAWKARQTKHNIDDFGNPLAATFPPSHWPDGYPRSGTQSPSPPEEDDEPVPGLVTTESENPVAVRVALASALESAAETDLRSPGLMDTLRRQQAKDAQARLDAGLAVADDNTPLLVDHRRTNKGRQETEEDRGWSAWFGR